jgi:hypothetical protein
LVDRHWLIRGMGQDKSNFTELRSFEDSFEIKSISP